MKNNGKNVAVIDIGSNSVRLFIFDVSKVSAKSLSSLKFFCGLGRDLGTTGLLNPEAVLLTQNALELFRQEIEKYKPVHEIVIGTAALREARDAESFISQVEKTTGFKIKIIDGEEEAHFAALAILSRYPNASGVVADFGGGSLELAEISKGEVNKKISLKLGAHYLKVLPKDPNARISSIKKILQEMLASNAEFLQPECLYLIGGSWRSLAKACLQKKGFPGKEGENMLENFIFEKTEIQEFCAVLQNMPQTELIQNYSMEPARAALMDVSPLLLTLLLEALSPQAVKTSTAGIRDGIVFDYIQTTSQSQATRLAQQ